MTPDHYIDNAAAAIYAATAFGDQFAIDRKSTRLNSSH